MLTRKQLELLQLIKKRLDNEGVPPSFEEMKEAIGLKSKSGIHRLITGLEERGFIKRLPHRARALEVLRMPDVMMEVTEDEDTDEGIKVTLPPRAGKIPSAAAPSAAIAAMAIQVAELPLYGRIAAGTPIEALADRTTHLTVPFSMIQIGRGTPDKDDFYALEISGDSMVEAGILDGDHIVVKKSSVARAGDIVVALIRREEATLKYFHKTGGHITLKPANKHYRDQVYAADDVEIQGQLVGLVRKY
jgi:repressor LexA